MTREFPRKYLDEAIQALNLDEDARVRPDYQGRGSYGRPGFGVVLLTMQDGLRLAASLGSVAAFSEALAGDIDADLVNDLMLDAHFDNMGHDAILYFNGWQLADR